MLESTEPLTRGDRCESVVTAALTPLRAARSGTRLCYSDCHHINVGCKWDSKVFMKIEPEPTHIGSCLTIAVYQKTCVPLHDVPCQRYIPRWSMRAATHSSSPHLRAVPTAAPV